MAVLWFLHLSPHDAYQFIASKCGCSLFFSVVAMAVCSDCNHVRTWTVTRFRGCLSTQPGSQPLASFNVMSLEGAIGNEGQSPSSSARDIGKEMFLMPHHTVWVPCFPDYKSHLFTWNFTSKELGATYNWDATYFQDFVKLTVRHAYAYAIYTKSLMRVSPDLVEGNFWNAMADSQNWGATCNRVRPIIREIRY